jgi:hypothetical protein
MGDELLHSYKMPAPARTGEALWTLTKDGVRITAELLDQSRAGMELRMLRNGEWQSGRRFADRVNAVAHAENHRKQLLTQGWMTDVNSAESATKSPQ